MTEILRVARADEIPEGCGKLVEIEGREIAILHLDGKYFAIDNSCPHMGGPLSMGELEDATVKCPWHGAIFDLNSGEPISGPTDRGVRTYEIRVSGAYLELFWTKAAVLS